MATTTPIQALEVDKKAITTLLDTFQKTLGGIVKFHSVYQVTDRGPKSYWYLEHIHDTDSVTNNGMLEFGDWVELKGFLITKTMAAGKGGFYFHALTKE